ncbi:hypothetical protein [Xenorhabdus szentirmaii]|uniref:Uncharacterized protein n=1 Tax=Xenorhabdus szentirmaii DSM 16338 TaxID=1427518 RepID=W1IVL8_9GAMM|nr:MULTISPECIES: hypothetical protein [Xenorhabdus]MBD2779627.1 hypothetical protein [Xenorhabdus sp. 38]PHM32794.1 hypothetical protein Xsze_03544 [Xenorhabdus szentirmaii DSM 16338]PHM40891.1 hypothetical protein Xszus_00566 [Xenorhabdus szentirmaii]CDL81270.1 hypothetical protein XSR1_120003 [Xenorhabdus szentirmaii DSM 16338]
MLKVTKDIFSGRENPSWVIPEVLANDILNEIATNKKSLNYGKGPSILGYKGFIVEIMDPLIANYFDLPTIFRVDDGDAEDVSGSQNLVKLLMDVVDKFNVNNYVINNYRRLSGRQYIRSQSNQDAVGKDKIKSGLPVITGVKCWVNLGIFNDLFWNFNSDIIKSNNCYSYAVNIRVPASSRIPHPGYCHTGRVPDGDSALIEGVKKDGLVFAKQDMTCPTQSNDPNNPVWLVALVSGYVGTDQEWDYHWYRKVWEGNESQNYFWAHKLGSSQVKRLGDGVEPEADAKNHGYNRFHGYFLVPNMTICGPY